MFNRLGPLAAACMLAPLGSAPLALADPPAPADPAQLVADAGPPPDTGAVPSEVPGIANSPDGWTLEVSAKDETQLAIPPLTTALSSREYLVGGTFTGVVKGNGKTKLAGGVVEAGYQIGCGIALNTVKLNGSVGLGITTTAFGAVPTGLTFPIQGQIEVPPSRVRSSTFRWTRSRSSRRLRATLSGMCTSRSTAAPVSPSYGPLRC